jgi:hypothetical protein
MINKNIKYDDEEGEGEVRKVIESGTPYFDLIGLTFISGLSLKKVAQLYIMLNIKTVEELYSPKKEKNLVDRNFLLNLAMEQNNTL